MTNRFLHAIGQGDKQVGLWVSLCSNIVAELCAGAGFDWAVIDMEHAPNDYLSVLSQLQAFTGSTTTPIVRVDWNDAVTVKRVLDLGAPGLLFPMINSVAEAERAVAATRYPPRGIRGFAGASRASGFGRDTAYAREVEDRTAVILQIETRAAIAEAAEIAAVDGVSGVFFGPADIAADIGKLGQPLDEAVWDLIRPAARRLIDRGVPVGTLVMDPSRAADLLNDGFTFVACGTDAALLTRATDAALAQVRDKLV